MNGTKDWWKSKTAWAGLVTLLIGLGNLLGIAIFGEGVDPAAIADQIVEILTSLVIAGTGFMAVYGRLTATKRISSSTTTTGAAMLLSLLVLPGMSGCQSPEQAWLASRESLSIANATVTQLHREGVISDDQAREAIPHLWTARSILAEAWLRLPAGDQDFSDLMQQAADAVAKVRATLNAKDTSDGRSSNAGSAGDDAAGGEQRTAAAEPALDEREDHARAVQRGDDASGAVRRIARRAGPRVGHEPAAAQPRRSADVLSVRRPGCTIVGRAPQL